MKHNYHIEVIIDWDLKLLDSFSFALLSKVYPGSFSGTLQKLELKLRFRKLSKRIGLLLGSKGNVITFSSSVKNYYSS